MSNLRLKARRNWVPQRYVNRLRSSFDIGLTAATQLVKELGEGQTDDIAVVVEDRIGRTDTSMCRGIIAALEAGRVARFSGDRWQAVTH